MINSQEFRQELDENISNQYVLDNFRDTYTWIYQDAVSLEEKFFGILIAEMEDGTVYIYNAAFPRLYTTRRSYESKKIFRKNFSIMVKDIIYMRGAWQDDLAEQIGICGMSLSRYINGERDISAYHMSLLAKALAVDVDLFVI